MFLATLQPFPRPFDWTKTCVLVASARAFRAHASGFKACLTDKFI